MSLTFGAEWKAAGMAAMTSIAFSAAATDFVPHPPTGTESVSPNGQYVLIVQSPDEWKSGLAVGRLFQQTASVRSLIWERTLPQQYGPRYALVGNKGQAVLFDEWNNVKSKYAIAILGRKQKDSNVVLDFDAVAVTLDTPIATIVERAASGWWMTGRPALDSTGMAAVVGAAGKCLWIDLDTGRLSSRDYSGNGCANFYLNT